MNRLRVFSGGQTGVDRAALDAALELGLPCGGWCPAGRRAEDGPIADRYPLAETDAPDYAQRTRLNVADADATLVLCQSALSGGSLLTVQLATAQDKHCLVVDLRQPWQPRAVQSWLRAGTVATLNIAGPRESSATGIYLLARNFLRATLALP